MARKRLEAGAVAVLKEAMRMHQDTARPVATDRALLQRCQQLVAAWEATDQTFVWIILSAWGLLQRMLISLVFPAFQCDSQFADVTISPLERGSGA